MTITTRNQGACRVPSAPVLRMPSGRRFSAAHGRATAPCRLMAAGEQTAMDSIPAIVIA
jgi:hypothetical protein